MKDSCCWLANIALTDYGELITEQEDAKLNVLTEQYSLKCLMVSIMIMFVLLFSDMSQKRFSNPHIFFLQMYFKTCLFHFVHHFCTTSFKYLILCNEYLCN